MVCCSWFPKRERARQKENEREKERLTGGEEFAGEETSPVERESDERRTLLCVFPPPPNLRVFLIPTEN